jgi:hypothetical protein
VQNFINQSTYTFPVLMQSGFLQNPPPTGYDLIYDNYVVVDADGIVRYTSQNRPRHPSTGRFYDAELRAAIQQWLPPPTSAGGDGGPAFYLRARSPSAASVRVEFGLPARSAVQLDVFDVTGRRVGVLVHGKYAAGPHSVRWERPPGRGASAAGVYFLNLRAGALTRTHKVVLVD